ncbi:hypothetical protein AB0J86_37020 [Micromonospora sp. NPDC049559]|uniref:hypothetical protein n=1 Tax=Micromonospora sp. NPDC049559 TaxID=3155923 RepID=UPI00341A8913
MKVSFARWLPAITPQQTSSQQTSSRQASREQASRRRAEVGAYRLGDQVRIAGRQVAEHAAGAARTTRQAVARVDGESVRRLAARTGLRKGALLVAGLAFVGGVAAGPGVLDAPAPSAAAPAPQAAPVAPAAPAAPAANDDGGNSSDDGAAPKMEQLIPYGTQGAQSSTPISPEQLDNARTIVHTARKMGLPERAAVIGVATSLQESKLNNLGHLGAQNDHDSLGLFQQRPSSGWGTPEQVTNPEYASRAFFDGLERVHGWQDMPLTDAAQSVQVSAYPFAYAQWEQQAADIVRSVDAGH